MYEKFNVFRELRRDRINVKPLSSYERYTSITSISFSFLSLPPLSFSLGRPHFLISDFHSSRDELPLILRQMPGLYAAECHYAQQREISTIYRRGKTKNRDGREVCFTETKAKSAEVDLIVSTDFHDENNQISL